MARPFYVTLSGSGAVLCWSDPGAFRFHGRDGRIWVQRTREESAIGNFGHDYPGARILRWTGDSYTSQGVKRVALRISQNSIFGV
jgi:hypothetical protein